MRILVTGGGGDMGRHAVRVLAEAAIVDEVIVADRDEGRASLIAQEVGPGASALALDISCGPALEVALRQVDMVLNTAGPFYRLGRPVLEAAIEAGADYLDICDDWEPTLEMLELDGRAREAGVSAVIGMGASPGISNLLAVLAMKRCDQVDRVFTAWRAGAGVPRPTPDDPEPEATAAVEHWVHNCSDPIKIWRDGEITDSWALQEIDISYPGRGEGPVWVCGHPEPLTIPRSRPEVHESLNVMTARPGLIDAIRRISARVRSGELDVPTASKRLLVESNMWGRAAGPSSAFPDLFAVVDGVKDGERIRVGARPLAVPDRDMGQYTGIPLAVAALMIARENAAKPGVHGPEAVIDADSFFGDLSRFAADPPAGAELVEIVTEGIAGASG